MRIFSYLTKQQKEATYLLSLGTILEYFDLMLYMHMAILLNEVFFPQTDPSTAYLFLISTNAITYGFRPIGALFFGYIGDNFGRKNTVIMTTTLMSLACIIMAILPPYAKIGIAASYIMIFCRGLQSISSMGELVGAQLYITEAIKPPAQYPIIGLIEGFASLGGVLALAVASLATSSGFNWRLAFWFGALVAVVGTVARTRLRETPEFANTQYRVKKIFQKNHLDLQELETSYVYNKKVNKKTLAAFFFLDCSWPIWFYIAFIYSSSILKDLLQLSTAQIIQQNFLVAISSLISIGMTIYLSCFIYPLLILRTKLVIFSGFTLIVPYLFDNAGTALDVLLIQVISVVFVPTITSAQGIFYQHFPVFKRFTVVAILFTLARVATVGLGPFIIHYLSKYLQQAGYSGHWAMLVITVPFLIGYIFGLNHFFKLEKAAGHYPASKIFDAAAMPASPEPS